MFEFFAILFATLVIAAAIFGIHHLLRKKRSEPIKIKK